MISYRQKSHGTVAGMSPIWWANEIRLLESCINLQYQDTDSVWANIENNGCVYVCEWERNNQCCISFIVCHTDGLNTTNPNACGNTNNGVNWLYWWLLVCVALYFRACRWNITLIPALALNINSGCNPCAADLSNMNISLSRLGLK